MTQPNTPNNSPNSPNPSNNNSAAQNYIYANTQRSTHIPANLDHPFYNYCSGIGLYIHPFLGYLFTVLLFALYIQFIFHIKDYEGFDPAQSRQANPYNLLDFAITDQKLQQIRDCLYEYAAGIWGINKRHRNNRDYHIAYFLVGILNIEEYRAFLTRPDVEEDYGINQGFAHFNILTLTEFGRVELYAALFIPNSLQYVIFQARIDQESVKYINIRNYPYIRDLEQKNRFTEDFFKDDSKESDRDSDGDYCL